MEQKKKVRIQEESMGILQQFIDRAVQGENVQALVQDLLSGNVNTKDEYGDTILLVAARGGYDGIVRELLEIEDIDIGVRGRGTSLLPPMTLDEEKIESQVKQLLSQDLKKEWHEILSDGKDLNQFFEIILSKGNNLVINGTQINKNTDGEITYKKPQCEKKIFNDANLKDLTDGWVGETALETASDGGIGMPKIKEGHVRTVELLLQKMNYNGGIVRYALAENKSRLLTKSIKTKVVDVRAKYEHGYTLLHMVAEFGDLNTLIELLANEDIELDIRNTDGKTAFDVASPQAKELIEYYTRVRDIINDPIGDNQDTFLHLVDNVNKAKLLWRLLGKNQQVGQKDGALTELQEQQRDKKNNKGQTALHYASQRGDIDLIKWFLRRGFNANAVDNNGQTPLHLAAQEGKTEVVSELVSCSEVNKQDSQGNTPLHLATVEGHVHTMIPLLVHEDIKIDVKNTAGDTVFDIAPTEAASLINYYNKLQRTNLDFQNPEGNTSLHLARHWFNVVLLMKLGADINQRNSNGDTPLHLAATNGHIDKVVELLASDEVDIDVTNAQGKKAVDLASNTNISDLILIRQQIPDIRTCVMRDKDTGEEIPLLFLAKNKYLLRLLVKRGVNIEEKDSQGQTFLHILVKEGKTDMVEELLKMGANPNVPLPKTQDTPLHLALKSGNNEVAKLLLKYGAVMWTPKLNH